MKGTKMDDKTACRFACGFFQEASRMSHMGCDKGEGLGRPTYTVIRRNLSANLMKTARRKTKRVLFFFFGSESEPRAVLSKPAEPYFPT